MKYRLKIYQGIIIASGNDACVALAEGIAGTEDEFSIMMTSKAKEIGMSNTNFQLLNKCADNYSTQRYFNYVKLFNKKLSRLLRNA